MAIPRAPRNPGGAGSFLSSLPSFGLPGLSGGDAGPSTASSPNNQSAWMGSPFAVGTGSSARANNDVGGQGASATSSTSSLGVLILAGLAIVVAGVAARK